MADTLSSNFCSLCGCSFDRFATEKENKRTSLSSPIVEESGLLDRLNIKISSLTKELLFICYSCCTVFTNYTEAKTNFHHREQEILKLLTEPVIEGSDKQGQLPFIPYLKRRCMTRLPSSLIPEKIPKIDDNGKIMDNGKTDTDNGKVNDNGRIGKDNGKVEVKAEVKEEPEMKNNKSGLENSQGGVKRKFVELLEKECHSSSLSELWESSKEFRDSCLPFLSLLIMKETSSILQQETLFNRAMNNKAFQEVSWGPTMEVLSKVAPATLCLLLALLGIDANMGSKEAVEGQHSIVGYILSMALYKRFRRRANFIPSLHSLYLHSMRVPARVRRTLHHLGLSIPPFRLSALLKILEMPENDLSRLWKRELERTLQIIPRRPKADDGPRKLPADRRKLKNILPKPVAVPSYGLCWGTVGSQVSATPSSPCPSLSQAYIVKNRVPFMMTYRDDMVRPADNIPFEEFVPDSEDFIRVRNQMKKEVQKILIQHLPLFCVLSVDEEHQYSELVCQKSQLSDLGAVFKNPSDSGSVASLMKNLKKSMVYDESEPISLCIFGDKDNVERMVRAKDVMSCFSDKVDRLDGMEPCIADHGRQVTLAKDIIAIFFPNGLQDRTSFLRHLSLDTKLLGGCDRSDFTSLQTLLHLLSHTYTLALGEKKYGMMMDEDKLSTEEKKNILEQLSDDIVSDIWPAVHTESLDTVRQGNKVVRDRECSFGDCINYRDKARLPCSERCARPFYLCCQKPLNDGLVECARRENCPQGAWFHINKKCSDLEEAPEDDWLCGSCSALRRVEGLTGRTDGLWEYHRALLWYCLFFLAGQTAETSGNGWLLHAIWKVSMPIFETQGHHDYLYLGYSFLSGVAGRIPRLAAHDSLHNRTVSLTGGPNNNLSWDSAVELISQETRDKSLQRRNTKEPSSPRRAEAYRLHCITTAWESMQQQKHKAIQRSMESVRDYAAQLQNLGVLGKVPGRQRVDDVEYSHVIRVRKPGMMVTVLRELCAKDVTRQMNEQESEVE